MAKYRVNDIVQFNESHEWVGCLGFIAEVKDCGGDYRYLVGVPVPQNGVTYIFSNENRNELEFIGRAVLGKPEGQFDGY